MAQHRADALRPQRGHGLHQRIGPRRLIAKQGPSHQKAALTVGTIMFSGSRFGTSVREPIHALHEIRRSCSNLIVLKVTSFTQHWPTINNKGAFRRLCRSTHSHSIVAGGFPEMS
jgi:hypothetical protein